MNLSPMPGLEKGTKLFELDPLKVRDAFLQFSNMDEANTVVMVGSSRDDVRQIFGVLIAPFTFKFWLDPGAPSHTSSLLLIIDAEDKHALIDWDELVANSPAYAQSPDSSQLADIITPLAEGKGLPLLSAHGVFQILCNLVDVRGFIGYYSLQDDDILEPPTPLTTEQRVKLLPGYQSPEKNELIRGMEYVPPTVEEEEPSDGGSADGLEDDDDGYQTASSKDPKRVPNSKGKGKETVRPSKPTFNETRKALNESKHPGYTRNVNAVWGPCVAIADALVKAEDPYMAKFGRHLRVLLRNGGNLTSQGLRKLLTVTALAVMAYNVGDRFEEVKKELESLVRLNRSKSQAAWMRSITSGSNPLWVGTFFSLRGKIMPGPRNTIVYLGPVWPTSGAKTEEKGFDTPHTKGESWAHWLPRKMAQAEGLLDLTSKSIQKVFAKLGENLAGMKKFILAKVLNLRIFLFPELTKEEIEASVAASLKTAAKDDEGLGITASEGRTWLAKFANWVFQHVKRALKALAAAKHAASLQLKSFRSGIRNGLRQKSWNRATEALLTPLRVRKANDFKSKVFSEWEARNPNAGREEMDIIEGLILRRVMAHFFKVRKGRAETWDKTVLGFRTKNEILAFHEDMQTIISLPPTMEEFDEKPILMEEKDIDT